MYRASQDDEDVSPRGSHERLQCLVKPDKDTESFVTTQFLRLTLSDRCALKVPVANARSWWPNIVTAPILTDRDPFHLWVMDIPWRPDPDREPLRL